MTIYLTLCVLFEKVLLFSLLSIIYFPIVGVETRSVSDHEGYGGSNTSLSNANRSKLIHIFRLNKAWIMTQNINNTNDSERRHSWEILRAAKYFHFYPISSLQYCYHLPWEFTNALKPRFEVAFSALYHMIKKKYQFFGKPQ